MMTFTLFGFAIIASIGIAVFAVVAAIFRSAKRGTLGGRRASTSSNWNSPGSTWDPSMGGLASNGFTSDSSGASGSGCDPGCTSGSSGCGDGGVGGGGCDGGGGGCGGGDGGGCGGGE